jgi:phosphoglycolate phosphatase
MIQLNLCDCQVPAHRSVMIGDSAADLGGARAAGLRAVLMSHGYSTHPAHTLGADATLNHFDELRDVLNRIMCVTTA